MRGSWGLAYVTDGDVPAGCVRMRFIGRDL